MKRLRKFVLIAAVVLVVAVAAAGWALNRWLQTPQARARIEQEIGKATRMQVKIGKLSFSAWNGLRVEGVTVPAREGNFFEAESLSVEHKFTSLFRGRIVLGEVRVVRPRVRMMQGADGKWRAPEPQAAAPAAPGPTVVAAPPAALPAAPIASPPKSKKHVGVSIGKIVITDGGVELIDRQRLPVATVKGLNVTLRDASEKASAGEFSIASVVIPGYATIDQIKGNTEHRDTIFSVRDLAANVCNGRVGGEFIYTPGMPDARVKIENVDISRAGKEARAKMRNASGVISGDVRLAGFEGGVKAMTGQGSIVIQSGRCTEIELVRQIGEVLKVAVLAGFEVREATANFRVASERIILAPLDVSLHPLGLAASGTIAFDGTTDLIGTLSAPSNIVARTGLVSAQFSPPDAAGRQSVQFDIKGTLDKPRQNLAAQLTGTTDRKLQRIIAVESVLSTLFGRKKVDPNTAAPPPPAPPRP